MAQYKFNGKELEGQTLHAKTLGFKHPVTQEYMEFNSEVPEYFKLLLKQVIVLLLASLIVGTINSKINLNSSLFMFIIKGCFSAIIPLIIILLFYWKDETFSLLKEKLKVVLKR